MSTEPADLTGMQRTHEVCYAIHPKVRVRKEAFGLLFYDTEESRLTFVKSGGLIQIKTFPQGRNLITAAVKPETRARVRKLLDHLLKKRLICDS